MSLTITIDRTVEGQFRAEVGDPSGLVIERPELAKLVEELKQTLDSLAVSADGRLLLSDPAPESWADDDAARAELERGALDNEELDRLIERFPVPSEWAEEPGWWDAL